MPSNHLILCHPLLLPPSIFPSIRVYSSESVLPIKCPKYSFNNYLLKTYWVGHYIKHWGHWGRLLRVPWTARKSDQSNLRKLVLNIHWKDWCWSGNSNTLATWCELTHWESPWCWKRLKAGGEGVNRGWDNWIASPTRWTWVWASSRSWWWTGKTGMLQFLGSQRVRHNWATELNWALFLPCEDTRRCWKSATWIWPR